MCVILFTSRSIEVRNESIRYVVYAFTDCTDCNGNGQQVVECGNIYKDRRSFDVHQIVEPISSNNNQIESFVDVIDLNQLD